MSFGWQPCELCGTRVPQGLISVRMLGVTEHALCMTCSGALARLEALGETTVDRPRFLDANAAMREQISEHADSETTLNPIDTLVRLYRRPSR